MITGETNSSFKLKNTSKLVSVFLHDTLCWKCVGVTWTIYSIWTQNMWLQSPFITEHTNIQSLNDRHNAMTKVNIWLNWVMNASPVQCFHIFHVSKKQETFRFHLLKLACLICNWTIHLVCLTISWYKDCFFAAL